MGLLERRPLRRALRRGLANWLERHQHPFNRGIHLVGIPLALVVAPILLFALPWDQWYWAALAFAGGYLLQWTGHRVEGNDLGEWAAIKRLLGLPYVAVAPTSTASRGRQPPDSAVEESGG
jgi:hypothetical protein